MYVHVPTSHPRYNTNYTVRSSLVTTRRRGWCRRLLLWKRTATFFPYLHASPPIFTLVHAILPHDNGCCCLGYRRAPRQPSFAGEIEAHVCVRFAPRRRAAIPPPLAPLLRHQRRIDLCRPFTPTTRRHPPSSYLRCHYHRRLSGGLLCPLLCPTLA